MAGLSNACYRVSVEKPVVFPDAVLYKKFECQIINKEVEAMIFKNMSDRGYGPKYIFQTSEYRIEQFIDARAITIWEMRNPIFIKAFAKAIYQFNFNQPAVE
jgi:Choline/ethanolamine kinase